MTHSSRSRIRSISAAFAGLFALTATAHAQPSAKAATSAQPTSKAATPPQTGSMNQGRDFGKFVKPSDDVLKKSLTKVQYEVTQHDDTEMPFHNTYWENHEAGIYVDVVSGEPLFSSKDKYESHTGWPSFTRPLEPKNIKQGTDTKLGYERTEIRSAHANSHLGHVFDDGPKPTGLRYCMNSASLKFIPVDKLSTEGYGDYLKLFK